MRRSFAFITVLAALLALTMVVARREARYFTRLAVADLARGRMPADYLASSIDDVNIAPAVESFLRNADPAVDPATALAVIEMHAAGVFSQNPDPLSISVMYQELLKAYPDSPLVHYRYASHLLSELQLLARKAPGGKVLLESTDAPGFTRAEELARDARRELMEVARSDFHNSLVCYETAYTYLVFGRTDEATEWFEKGIEAPEFDPGDDTVLAACARIVTDAGIPPLEGLISVYRVARYNPSYVAARMEALSIELLSDATLRERKAADQGYGDYLASFEDLSEKLFQTAQVVRQSQASFVTAGILWRKMIAEASRMNDEGLYSAGQKKLATVSYRYLLVGWQRAGLGLPPQQSIMELGVPFDLRLPFSPVAQGFARAFLLGAAATLLPAVIIGIIAIKLRPARQLALALVVLFIFSSLAFSGTFYSVLSERAHTAHALERRLQVELQGPEYVRRNGQPDSPADFRTDIPKEMLYTLNYTMQAGRVLSYIGTRDCFETLIGSLSNPEMVRPVEILVVLKEATGVEYAADVSGIKSDNADAIRFWQEWWEKNRALFPETADKSPAERDRQGA